MTMPRPSGRGRERARSGGGALAVWIAGADQDWPIRRWPIGLCRSDLVRDAGDGAVAGATVADREGAAGNRVGRRIGVQRVEVGRRAPPAIGDLLGGPVEAIARAAEH